MVTLDLKRAGKTLRAIRESHRMSQEDVAAKTQINLARLSYIERGIIKKPPSILDMAELGELYGLSPHSLFTIYGLPEAKTVAHDAAMELPEELVALSTALQDMPDEASKAEVLGMVLWVVDMANAKRLTKGEPIAETSRRAVRARAKA